MREEMHSRNVVSDRNVPELSGEIIYTIVRTGCDAGHGVFPDPIAESSFASRERAEHELDRLIEKEKRFISPQYDYEDRGETWWEMNESCVAAVHFTRLEILESELVSDAR